MDKRVVVVRPFGPHARGDMLTDPDEVRKLLASEHVADVVRTAVVPPTKRDSVAGGTNGSSAKGS